jgi:hypothetical protein
VLAELRAVSDGAPVSFATVRDRLLPGSPGGGVTGSEASGLSQALVRLRKAGLAKRHKNLWTADA